MTPRFIVRSPAEADVAEAFEWYEQRIPGLGLEFLRAVDVTFAIIARAPELFPPLQKGIRRARLRRFPYGVFFIERSGTISVLAVMHAHRDPRRWLSRA
jgi:toxin ParE1/3/4